MTDGIPFMLVKYIFNSNRARIYFEAYTLLMKELRPSIVEKSLVRALEIELPKLNDKSGWPVDWDHANANPTAR